MADFKDSLIFPAGERFDNENFSGEVWLKMLTGMPCPVANVTFAPACRNNWHTHRGGQILLVTAGRGYYQEWGEDARELRAGDVVEIPAEVARELRAGDVVEIPAEVKHWHGAAPDSWFSHIAIEIHPELGPATWLEPVSDEVYGKLK